MVCTYGPVPCRIAVEDSVEASDAVRRENRSMHCHELGNTVSQSLVTLQSCADLVEEQELLPLLEPAMSSF
jgi:hypothetical protein